MTDQEINEMVARKLGIELGNLKPRDYCHSIKAAWEVVEKAQALGSFALIFSYVEPGLWYAGWGSTGVEGFEFDLDATADTAPRAICEAFLKLEDK